MSEVSAEPPSTLEPEVAQPVTGLNRIGQPWAAEALGKSPLRWAVVLLSGAALAWMVATFPGGITADSATGRATTVVWMALMAVAPLIFVADAKLRIIPDRIILPLAALTALLLLGDLIFGSMGWGTAVSAVASGLILGGYALTLWLIAPERGYGWGDVKLTALAGLILGTHSIWLAIVALAIIPPLLAIVPFLVVASRSKTPEAVALPFGPFLVAGISLATFAQTSVAAMSPLV